MKSVMKICSVNIFDFPDIIPSRDVSSPSEKNTPMECALESNQLDVYKIILTFDKEV